MPTAAEKLEKLKDEANKQLKEGELTIFLLGKNRAKKQVEDIEPDET